MKTLEEKRANAELQAGRLLAKANIKKEAGKDDTKEMQMACNWLDKLNKYEGKG